MHPADSIPKNLRDFALQVVLRLRGAGFEALWAGGCVRDDLLGITPKDYDVATGATPAQVVELFGAQKTIPIGASFGVIMVLGPNKECGQVEVATFRADGEYLDGRRPAEVTFCSAEEDAKRRDFTINGMFYEPVAGKVIDYVGGLQDLSRRMVRAIGDATARFTEDKLRMLRAVRFAATYEFRLDQSTACAIRELRGVLTQVSAERIAQELRRMLAHRTRAVSVQKLADTGLLEILFPDVFGSAAETAMIPQQVEHYGRILGHLHESRFESALAILLKTRYDSTAALQKHRLAGLRKECRRLRLANAESDCICWIAESAHICRDAEQLPLHVIKPILADPRHFLLLDVLRAESIASGKEPIAAEHLREYLAKTPAERMDPPTLVNGSDLRQLGIEPGPVFKQILNVIREEQLDEQLNDRPSALTRLRQLADRKERS